MPISRRRDAIHIVHPLLRLMALLLAIVQIVAPMWHVCEMGGSSCGECVQAIAANAATGQSAPCKRCRGPQGAAASSGAVVKAHNACPFQGTCLARLLESMPGSCYTHASLIAPSSARCPATCSIYAAPQLVSRRQSSGRGPPVLAFL